MKIGAAAARVFDGGRSGKGSSRGAPPPWREAGSSAYPEIGASVVEHAQDGRHARQILAFKQGHGPIAAPALPRILPNHTILGNRPSPQACSRATVSGLAVGCDGPDQYSTCCTCGNLKLSAVLLATQMGRFKSFSCRDLYKGDWHEVRSVE